MTDRTVPTEEFIVTLPISPSAADCAGAPAVVVERIIRTVGRPAGSSACLLAASPPAPGAEVEPVAIVGETCTHFVGDSAPPAGTRLYLSPPTTDAIRAQARREAMEEGFRAGIEAAAEEANGVETDLLKGMSDRYVSIYCTARRDAADAIKALPDAACEYCGGGKRTGLPGNACETCLGTGLKYPRVSK